MTRTSEGQLATLGLSNVLRPTVVSAGIVCEPHDQAKMSTKLIRIHTERCGAEVARDWAVLLQVVEHRSGDVSEPLSAGSVDGVRARIPLVIRFWSYDQRPSGRQCIYLGVHGVLRLLVTGAMYQHIEGQSISCFVDRRGSKQFVSVVGPDSERMGENVEGAGVLRRPHRMQPSSTVWTAVTHETTG